MHTRLLLAGLIYVSLVACDSTTQRTQAETRPTASNPALYVTDHGQGRPVVLLAGWPYGGELW